MARIGLSKPYAAIYSASGTTVSYTKRILLGKYTNIDLSLENGDDNILYADNGPAESDNTFSGGTVTITLDDLRPDAMADALGLTSETISTTGLTTTSPKWLKFDDDQAAPYMAIGGIIKLKVDGAVKFRAFVLEKVKFKNPGMSIATQGETIEWQTPDMEADVFRSDDAKHTWHRISSLLDLESDAVAILEDYLEVPSPEPGDGDPEGI